MTFFLLKKNQPKKIPIQKKQRISLIIPFSVTSVIIFFKDQTYEHFDTEKQEIIFTAKLSFKPTKQLETKSSRNIAVLGQNEHKNTCLSIMRIDETYKTEILFEGQITNKKCKFFYYENQDKQIYIVQVIENIQNGLGVSIFNIYENKWSEDVLYLNSRYLQFKFLNTGKNINQKKQVNSYVLVSNGQKMDSFHYTKIYFYKNESQNLKQIFQINRQVKIPFIFTLVGLTLLNPQTMLLTGNSKLDDILIKQENKLKVIGCHFTVNMIAIENNQKQNFKIKRLIRFEDQKNKISRGREIIIRKFLGEKDNCQLLLLCQGTFKIIAKVSQRSSEQLFQLRNHSSFDFTLTSCLDSIVSYELICEQFFEKIKNSPSIISLLSLKILSKESQYKGILKEIKSDIKENLMIEIINLLR